MQNTNLDSKPSVRESTSMQPPNVLMLRHVAQRVGSAVGQAHRSGSAQCSMAAVSTAGYTYKWPRPAVTVDTLIFNVHGETKDLRILLIERGGGCADWRFSPASRVKLHPGSRPALPAQGSHSKEAGLSQGDSLTRYVSGSRVGVSAASRHYCPRLRPTRMKTWMSLPLESWRRRPARRACPWCSSGRLASQAEIPAGTPSRWRTTHSSPTPRWAASRPETTPKPQHGCLRRTWHHPVLPLTTQMSSLPARRGCKLCVAHAALTAPATRTTLKPRFTGPRAGQGGQALLARSCCSPGGGLGCHREGRAVQVMAAALLGGDATR